MNDFYDPAFYDLRIGPGVRVGAHYLQSAITLGGPVLELGCGTGDVLLPIARAGIPVFGVDRSPLMIGAFRQRLEQEHSSVRQLVTLVEAPMEDLPLSIPQQTFGLVIIPNDGIAHLLDATALRATLQGCQRVLNTAGQLILDIAGFDVEYLGRFSGQGSELARSRGWHSLPTGEDLQVIERTVYDPATGVLAAHFRYEYFDRGGVLQQTRCRTLRLHPRPVDEVVFAVEAAGFAPPTVAPLHLVEPGAQGHVVSATVPASRPLGCS